MSMLSGVTRGKMQMPELIIAYGPDGVGKTTFAAGAPNVVFLGSEKGTANLDVARLPTPLKFEDCQSAVTELLTQPHDFKSLAIDSLDWMEPLVWDKLCRDHGAPNIEAVGGGFGKGYTFAVKMWADFCAQLSMLREKRGMNVIILAHAQVKTFQDPQQNAAYDRYQLKLHEKSAAVLREFVDCVLFMNYEVFTKVDDRTKKTRAFGEGVRVMHTERRPAYDAKNRFGLPEQIPFTESDGWQQYIASKNASNSSTPESIFAQIQSLKKMIQDAELLNKVDAAILNAGQDTGKLSAILKRLRVLLNQ